VASSDASLSDSEAPQIEQPRLARHREQPQVSRRRERPPRSPERIDWDAELNDMNESLREKNEQSMLEKEADEREREHHFRVQEAHSRAVEDPRGRSRKFDFVINANTAELPRLTLPPFVKMLNYSTPQMPEFVSRQIMRK